MAFLKFFIIFCHLKRYVQQFTDDDANWHLLTGYTQEEIVRFAHEQFSTIVQKPVDSDQIIHRSSFYLIDQNANIVNKYHYSNDRYVQELINDIEKLAKWRMERLSFFGIC